MSAMMAAAVGSDSSSDLVTAVVDPAVYGQRLQALTDKASQVASYAAQAREENLKSEQNKKDAEAIHAATLDLLQANTAKEEELKKREAALADRLASADVSAAKLAEDKALFEQYVTAAKAANAKREEELRQAAAAHIEAIAQAKADVAKEFSDKKASHDAEHKARMDELSKLEQDLVAKLNAAQAARVDAEKKRLEHENKLSELKKIVGV